MATKIVTKNSSTASAAPTASDLVQGELAVNVTDKRLYTENASGAIVELGTSPSTIDINAGTIDGTVIGGATPAAISGTTGQFGTSLNVDGTATVDGLTVVSTGIVASLTSSGTATYLELNNTHANGWGSNIAFKTGGTAAGYFGSIGSLLGNTDQDLATYATAGNGIRFYTNANNERMRIDSSGNVLVGKTSPDSATVGVEAKANGNLHATVAASHVTVFNRKTSDGAISLFQKNGTTVGSIGTNVGRLTIGSGDTGVIFAGDIDAIYPANGLSARDNAIDIGSTGARFKDLYLSGGVVFGPASASTVSSQTLDSYEEGTFTPTLAVAAGSITHDTRVGTYIKVGSLVTCTISISLSAISSPSGTVNITGLPFTNALGEGFVSAIAVGIARDFSSALNIKGYVHSNVTTIALATGTEAEGHVNMVGGDLSASTRFYISFAYRSA